MTRFDSVSRRCGLLSTSSFLFQIGKEVVFNVRQAQGSMINSLSFQYLATLDHVRLVVANNYPKYGVQGYYVLLLLSLLYLIFSFVVFEMPSMQLVTSFAVPSAQERTAVGAAEVSPDGSRLVVLGDNAEVPSFYNATSCGVVVMVSLVILLLCLGDFNDS